MEQDYQRALREVMALGSRKGLVYLSPRTLRRLARVQARDPSLRIGSGGHYEAIAHHAHRDRFERREFIVVPDTLTPSHGQLFEIVMATLGYRSGHETDTRHGDIVDLLRASLVYPRMFDKAARLMTDLGVGLPRNADEDYQHFVEKVVMDNLQYPSSDAPGTRAMRMKLVFLDALPVTPSDPRLTDYQALVKLAETVAEQTA